MLEVVKLAAPEIDANLTRQDGAPVPTSADGRDEGTALPRGVYIIDTTTTGSDRAERVGNFYVSIFAASPEEAERIARQAEVLDGARRSNADIPSATYHANVRVGPQWDADQQAYFCQVRYEVRYREAETLRRLSTA
jgi:hypothetical protein